MYAGRTSENQDDPRTRTPPRHQLLLRIDRRLCQPERHGLRVVLVTRLRVEVHRDGVARSLSGSGVVKVDREVSAHHNRPITRGNRTDVRRRLEGRRLSARNHTRHLDGARVAPQDVVRLLERNDARGLHGALVDRHLGSDGLADVGHGGRHRVGPRGEARETERSRLASRNRDRGALAPSSDHRIVRRRVVVGDSTGDHTVGTTDRDTRLRSSRDRRGRNHRRLRRARARHLHRSRGRGVAASSARRISDVLARELHRLGQIVRVGLGLVGDGNLVGATNRGSGIRIHVAVAGSRSARAVVRVTAGCGGRGLDRERHLGGGRHDIRARLLDHDLARDHDRVLGLLLALDRDLVVALGVVVPPVLAELEDVASRVVLPVPDLLAVHVDVRGPDRSTLAEPDAPGLHRLVRLGHAARLDVEHGVRADVGVDVRGRRHLGLVGRSRRGRVRDRCGRLRVSVRGGCHERKSSRHHRDRDDELEDVLHCDPFLSGVASVSLSHLHALRIESTLSEGIESSQIAHPRICSS